jgi:hypothetical protein
MGQSIWAWVNVTEKSVQLLFNGSDSSIGTLWDIIKDGKLIEGSLNNQNPPTIDSDAVIQASIVRAFYAYTIPLAWTLSGTKAFVMDSGYACGTVDPVSPYYISSGDASKTSGCYNSKLYYLVYPSGEAESTIAASCPTCSPEIYDSPFSVPPGLDMLDGSAYGAITVQDLISGAVRTYLSNGDKNGGGSADITSHTTLDDMYNQDITSPGYIRIPVCGPQEAHDNWANSPSTTSNYPCN